MAISATLSFTDLIIVSTVAFSIFFLFIQIRNSKRHTNKFAEPIFSDSRIGDSLGYAAIAVTIVVLGLSFFERNSIWFIVRLLSMGLVSFYSWGRPRSNLIPLLLVINVAAASLAPIVSLGFSAGEVDQIGHALATNIILANGHISPVQESSLSLDPYYNLFPIVDFLTSGISLATGLNVFGAFALAEIVVPVIATIGIVYLSYLFTRNYFTAVLAILLLLATDRLAIWTLIPQNFATFYAIIAFVPLGIFVLTPSRIPAFFVILFASFSNFTHASLGGLFLASIVLIAIFGLFSKKLISTAKTTILALGVTVSVLSYWTIWNITSSVSSRLIFIFENFLNSFTSKFALLSATKRSLLAISTPYAFLSWAIPAALAFSYVGYKFLAPEEGKKFTITKREDLFFISTTIVAFFILLTGLYTSYSSGLSSIERYSDVPAFAVFMITGGISAALAIKKGNRGISAIIIGILLVSLFLGSMQLNWAPDQYQGNYGYTNQQQFSTSHTMSNLLPTNIVIYPAETLGYLFYWNSTKAATILQSNALAQPIDNNRSTTISFMISYASAHNIIDYFAFEPSLVINYNRLANSPNMNLVFNNGQQEIITVSG